MKAVLLSRPALAVLAGGVGGAVGHLTARYSSPDITYEESPPPVQPVGARTLVQPVSPASRAAQILAFGVPRPPAPGPLVYNNHVLEYDSARKVPRWVAEHLTRQNIEQTVANRKGVKFDRDPSVPAMFSSDNTDYWGSGWSRGHMAPAGNNKHCQDSMKDTFFLTNIVPQDFDNNGGYWNRLEMWCRDLTKSYQDVWVISGPLWMPSLPDNETGGDGDGAGVKRRGEVRTVKYSVLGAGQVAVPTHLYKIILVTDPNLDKPLLGSFIVPNVPIADKHLEKFQVKLEDIEKNVGIIFHPSLQRNNVGDLCVRSGCNLEDYKKFMHFFWSRRLKSPWNMQNLENDWKAAQDSGFASEELVTIFNESKSRLEEKEKLKTGSEKSVSKEVTVAVQ